MKKLCLRHYPLTLICILGPLLTGCGEGGNDSGAENIELSGLVVDDIVSGGVIYQDINNNGQKDSGEPSARTDKEGHFSYASDGTDYCADQTDPQYRYCLKLISRTPDKPVTLRTEAGKGSDNTYKTGGIPFSLEMRVIPSEFATSFKDAENRPELSQSTEAVMTMVGAPLAATINDTNGQKNLLSLIAAKGISISSLSDLSKIKISCETDAANNDKICDIDCANSSNPELCGFVRDLHDSTNTLQTSYKTATEGALENTDDVANSIDLFMGEIAEKIKIDIITNSTAAKPSDPSIPHLALNLDDVIKKNLDEISTETLDEVIEKVQNKVIEAVKIYNTKYESSADLQKTVPEKLTEASLAEVSSGISATMSTVKEAKTAGGCSDKTGTEKLLCNSKLMVLLKVADEKAKIREFLFNAANDDLFTDRRLLISCLARNLVQAKNGISATGEISDNTIRNEIKRKCLPKKDITLTDKLAVGKQLKFSQLNEVGEVAGASLYLFFLDKNNGITTAEDNTSNRAFVCASPSSGTLDDDIQITNAVWWRGKDTNEMFIDILGQIFNIMLIADDDNSLTFFTELNMDSLQTQSDSSTESTSTSGGGTKDIEATSPTGFSTIDLNPIPSGTTAELLDAWKSHCAALFN